MQTIKLQFENEIYRCELPVSPAYTGQISLVFNFKHGLLMKAEVGRNNYVTVITDSSVDKPIAGVYNGSKIE